MGSNKEDTYFSQKSKSINFLKAYGAWKRKLDYECALIKLDELAG